ncbi:hypothetical protein C9885_29760, partial [Klebsiella pneumoniae]
GRRRARDPAGSGRWLPAGLGGADNIESINNCAITRRHEVKPRPPPRQRPGWVRPLASCRPRRRRQH